VRTNGGVDRVNRDEQFVRKYAGFLNVAP